MELIFGLGSGRCGTTSLAALLNRQPDVCCFHELAPSVMAWEGAEATVGSLLRDFGAIGEGGPRWVTADRVVPERETGLARLGALEQVTALGDVASYYLPYVAFILEQAPGARFPVLRRDRDETVRSFVRKLTDHGGRVKRRWWEPPQVRNHWLPRADKRWVSDLIWDKNFPGYDLPDGSGLEDYVARYYDDYYARVGALEEAFPESLRVFGLEHMTTRAGRAEILEFCLPGRAHVDAEAHLNKG